MFFLKNNSLLDICKRIQFLPQLIPGGDELYDCLKYRLIFLLVRSVLFFVALLSAIHQTNTHLCKYLQVRQLTESRTWTGKKSTSDLTTIKYAKGIVSNFFSLSNIGCSWCCSFYVCVCVCLCFFFLPPFIPLFIPKSTYVSCIQCILLLVGTLDQSKFPLNRREKKKT